MRNRTITLVDLGLDASLNASMQFVQATLDSINAGHDEPVADVNFVRSRDEETIWGALTSPSTVLHVMAHGDHSQEPAFLSSDGESGVTLSSLADAHSGPGTGIAAPIVLADGCKTGIGVWQRAVRDCLQGPVAYVGTSAAVGWYEGTVFGAAFYGALLQRRGRGSSALDQGLEAAGKAAEAYRLITGTKCPYRAVPLEPSRRAKAAGKGHKQRSPRETSV